jgi:mRNA interferase YafQ
MARQGPTLTPKPTPRFRKDHKLQVKRGPDPLKLHGVVTLLCERRTPPESLRDHALTGDWKGWRDCHIEPDWLLIYRVDEGANELVLGRTGTHSDLLD